MLASLHDSRQFSLRFSDHNVSNQEWSECHSGPHAGSQKQWFALVGAGHGYLSRARYLLLLSQLTSSELTRENLNSCLIELPYKDSYTLTNYLIAVSQVQIECI